MAKPLTVLIVEDSESDTQLVVRLLEKAGYEVTFEQVETAAQMRAALQKQPWQIVISDYSMPQFDGPAALTLLQEMGVDIPFITVSGTVGEETAVGMMKAGAYDYLMKGNLVRLAPAVERELSQFEVRRKRRQAEEQIRQRLSELEVLYQSGLELSQLVSPKTIAQKMINLLDQKMDWHHTAIRLYHPENETLELLAFNTPSLKSEEEHDLVEELFKTSVTRLGHGFSGWVIEHGEVVRSNDLKNDPRYLETFPGLQSGLYVPIKTADRVIGVISIESEQANAFSESDERLTITLAAQAAVAIDNVQLLSDLQRSNTELALAYDATIEGWSHALDMRDKETEGHTLRVTEMTMKLARAFGLSDDELVHVRRGALLHDIGKMGIPDGILLKPGPLSDEEWIVMKKHPGLAYEMLLPIPYLHSALDIPYCHHEKWDGSGYPRGLKGEQIPLVARIFAVVDVWDALRSDRPYRAAWPKEKVCQHIESLAGTHFDPQVVKVFLASDIFNRQP